MGTKYAHKRIRTELEQQIKTKENSLRFDIPQPDKVRDDIKRDKQILTEMTPPDLTAEQRKIMERQQEKLTDAILAGKDMSTSMPTYDEMNRANNAIGVDKHTAHQNFILLNRMDADGNIVRCKPGEQGLADVWKDNQRTLHREAEDDLDNVASLETIRPKNNQGASRLIDYPKAQFAQGAGLSYEQWVFAHVDAWPPYNGVKAGLYDPFFKLDEAGNMVRSDTYHPAGYGLKPNPFAGEAEAAEVKVEAPVSPVVGPPTEDRVIQTKPPYTRCQAVNKINGQQCRMNPLRPNVPWCRFATHRAQLEQVQQAS